MIFETHAHYDDEAFDEDRELLLGEMRQHAIQYIVNVGASLQGIRDTFDLMQKYDFIYGALGVHPDEVGELTEEKIQWIKGLLGHEKAVAVGEIGLDYYWDKQDHLVQKKWFVRQLQLAKECNLPIVVHSRDAAQDTFDIIKREHAGTTGGVIHCYSGSVEMAGEYVKMGYYIGIGGVVTFKNARVLKKVAAEIPLEHIVVETDSPYLAPVPNRGKRNSSLNLPYVIAAIAAARGITAEEVESQTFENALKLYRL